MLEIICKSLGVKFNEEWLGNDGNKYIITEDDVFIQFLGHDEWFVASSQVHNNIKLGIITVDWKPKIDDVYYIPDINYSKDFLDYRVKYWENSDEDKFYYNRGLVFRTKDEATECVNRMLEVIK